MWILYSCVYAAYGMPSHDLINILGRCFEQYHHQESNDGHSLSRLGLFFFARCDIEHQPKNRNILFLKIIRKKVFLEDCLGFEWKNLHHGNAGMWNKDDVNIIAVKETF